MILTFKRTLILSLLAAAAASTVGGLRRVQADAGCSLQSLSGAYTYALSGEYFTQRGDLYHFSSAGRIMSDGAGNMEGKDTISDGAVITRGRQYSATYKVNADCTGSA